MEEWKDAVGYEGLYEVSNQGRVRTNENKITFSKKHGERKWKQRVLKQKTSKDKCCRVSLWKNGEERTWLVHRIVAFAFIPKVKDKNFINHIDGNRLNNCVENLEWCTSKENNNHAFDHGLIASGVQIILIDENSKDKHHFRSMSKACEFLGRNHGYISSLLKRNKTRTQGYEIVVNKEVGNYGA